MTAAVDPEPELPALIALIGARTGLAVPKHRHVDVRRGAHALMQRHGVARATLLERLRDEARLLDELIAEIAVGETYFFRDPEQFSFIRDRAVPQLHALRGAGHVLRAWSAGCASGEEAYSLAIVFEEMGLAAHSRILATDISRAALARARAARYARWSIRGAAQVRMAPYLRATAGRFELAPRLRARVDLAYLNLADPTWSGLRVGACAMDLILCRNVLIYLDRHAVRTVARRLHDALAPGGILLTGGADPVLAEHASFVVETWAGGLVYRRPMASIADARSRGALAPSPTAAPGPSTASSAPVPQARDARPVAAAPQRQRSPSAARADTAGDERAAARVRALANAGDHPAALRAATDGIDRHPTSLELLFAGAMLLLSLQRHREAVPLLRRLTYLDPSQPVAHFALGVASEGAREDLAAARAYRTAQALASRAPADAALRFGDGQCAAALAHAACARLEALRAGARRSIAA